MTPTTRETLRVRLLLMLNEVAGADLPLSTLVLGARLAGIGEADDKVVGAEMSYLEDKGLVVAEDKRLSPENKEWRIAAGGRDYLATRGL